jgi:hypothetical protein
MNADELRALAERVQGLDGPDREVDARIWCALNGKKYAGYFEPFGVTDGRFVAVEYTEPPKRTRLVTGGNTGTKHALRFTASLDAAMTLYMHKPDMIHSCPRKVAAHALEQRATFLEKSGST